ncbi:DUF6221 family protein [Actinomadura hibisca]|uniref:DUF6221 family protein n=1 Tax=Actinomadura hibisca TaxID=68565 RepID=UPI00083669CC|nr:DUF6221 family protein [Actinomadura hibisca]
MTLVEFLRARLDEDENTARTAAEDVGATVWYWKVADETLYAGRPSNTLNSNPFAVGARGFMEPGVGGHIARHDPARVRRDVEVNRQRLAQHTGIHRCDWGEHHGSDVLGWCSHLKRLAYPYSDHPDYNEAWRPDLV